jgi:acetoacetyl-CoA synthetase
MMANVPETIIASLGAAAIGAVWSSCSPTSACRACSIRFGQIAPTVFVAVDGYRYGGKRFSCTGKIAAIAAALPSVRQVVIVPFVGEPIAEEGISRSVPWTRMAGRRIRHAADV